MNDGFAWIEGEYVPIAEARIPILDWGFLRSDCTYDVIHVWKGGSSGLATIWTGSRRALRPPADRSRTAARR